MSTSLETKTPDYAIGTSDVEIEAAARLSAKKRHRKVIFWRWAILILWLSSWELITRSGELLDYFLGPTSDGPRKSLMDPFFYSSPSLIAERLYQWVTEGTALGPLWMQVGVTMWEAVLGFILGALVGVLIGVALGVDRFLAEVFSIYIKVANSIPRIVLAPIFTLIFGLGLVSKVALAFVMVFFVVFANAYQGVREADRNLLSNAQILGASRWDLTRTVIVPSALTWIFASLHVSFGLAIVGAIVGEFVGSRAGIGQLISIARGSFDPAGVFAGMIVILIVALLADLAMSAIEQRILKWRPKNFVGDHD